MKRMRLVYAGFALAAMGAAMIAGGDWLFRRTSPPAAPAPRTSGGMDIAHEKLFLTEQLSRNATHAPILLRLAQIERGEGNLKDARQHLEQAVAADATQVDVRLELSLVCWDLGDYAAAEQHNRAVLKLDPGQPDALYNLGAIHANRGDPVQARAFWKQALARGGESAEKAQRALEQPAATR
jgi:tetratricopeptide (TPR) repeat protein